MDAIDTADWPQFNTDDPDLSRNAPGYNDLTPKVINGVPVVPVPSNGCYRCAVTTCEGMRSVCHRMPACPAISWARVTPETMAQYIAARLSGELDP